MPGKSRGTAWVVACAVVGLVGCGERARPRVGGPWDHLLTPGEGRFLHVSSFDTTGGNRDRHEIAPGDSAVLLDVEGSGVIRRLWITVASDDPHYLRRIALKMYWDGETDPSVAVPLGDFFGNGFDKVHYISGPMGVSSGGFYSYLPMPFSSRARVVAENGTGQVVDAFYFNADVETDLRLDLPVATFHAEWRRDPRTADSAPHVIADLRGTGHLVGVSLNAESYSGSLWFLEGDEIFTVDGEFRGQGTGTEDYFNGGWYFQDGPFSAPYHGVVALDGEKGRVAAYRWHLPDPVRFRESLRMELEHGHGNGEVADYATVAYWYQTEPHQLLEILPPADDRRVLDVKIPPGSVEGDAVEVHSDDSGQTQLRVPIPRPDAYDVWIYPEGQDGLPEEAVLLGRAMGESAELEIQLPVGADPPLAVHPVPVRRWARAWWVLGPYPNPQIVGTEYSSGLDSVYAPEEDPSLDRIYAGEGGTELRWQAVTTDTTGYVRLNPHFDPNDWATAFAQAFLFSPDDRDATLLLGADDAHQLWVGGELVSSRQGRNISTVDDLEVRVRLVAGWNRVLLKVADLDGGWAFQLRVADPEGVLRWSRVPGG